MPISYIMQIVFEKSINLVLLFVAVWPERVTALSSLNAYGVFNYKATLIKARKQLTTRFFMQPSSLTMSFESLYAGCGQFYSCGSMFKPH